jgi:hypothetical protein
LFHSDIYRGSLKQALGCRVGDAQGSLIANRKNNMNTFAKSMLSLAFSVGLCTSAFAQNAPAPTSKAPGKADGSKPAATVPSVASDKVQHAKQPTKKPVQSKTAESSAVKPLEAKKSDSGTVHNTAKNLSKPEMPAKSVK